MPDITLEKLAAENIQGAEDKDKEGFLRFLRRILCWLPEERPSAKDLIFDPWLIDGLGFTDEQAKHFKEHWLEEDGEEQGDGSQGQVELNCVGFLERVGWMPIATILEGTKWSCFSPLYVLAARPEFRAWWSFVRNMFISILFTTEATYYALSSFFPKLLQFRTEYPNMSDDMVACIEPFAIGALF